MAGLGKRFKPALAFINYATLNNQSYRMQYVIIADAYTRTKF